MGFPGREEFKLRRLEWLSIRLWPPQWSRSRLLKGGETPEARNWRERETSKAWPGLSSRNGLGAGAFPGVGAQPGLGGGMKPQKPGFGNSYRLGAQPGIAEAMKPQKPGLGGGLSPPKPGLGGGLKPQKPGEPEPSPSLSCTSSCCPSRTPLPNTVPHIPAFPLQDMAMAMGWGPSQFLLQPSSGGRNLRKQVCICLPCPTPCQIRSFLHLPCSLGHLRCSGTLRARKFLSESTLGISCCFHISFLLVPFPVDEKSPLLLRVWKVHTGPPRSLGKSGSSLLISIPLTGYQPPNGYRPGAELGFGGGLKPQKVGEPPGPHLGHELCLPHSFGYRNGGLGSGVFPEARAQPGFPGTDGFWNGYERAAVVRPNVAAPAPGGNGQAGAPRGSPWPSLQPWGANLRPRYGARGAYPEVRSQPGPYGQLRPELGPGPLGEWGSPRAWGKAGVGRRTAKSSGDWGALACLCALGGPEVKRGSNGLMGNGYGGERECRAPAPTHPMPPSLPLQAALGDTPSPRGGHIASSQATCVCLLGDWPQRPGEGEDSCPPGGKEGDRAHHGPALPLPRLLPSWEMLSSRADLLPTLSSSVSEPGLPGEAGQTLGLGLWPGVSCGLELSIKAMCFPVCLCGLCAGDHCLGWGPAGGPLFIPSTNINTAVCQGLCSRWERCENSGLPLGRGASRGHNLAMEPCPS
nr:collagen alpha-1(I) chain-like isoform X5 [Globicephala melas]